MVETFSYEELFFFFFWVPIMGRKETYKEMTRVE